MHRVQKVTGLVLILKCLQAKDHIPSTYCVTVTICSYISVFIDTGAAGSIETLSCPVRKKQLIFLIPLLSMVNSKCSGSRKQFNMWWKCLLIQTNSVLESVPWAMINLKKKNSTNDKKKTKKIHIRTYLPSRSIKYAASSFVPRPCRPENIPHIIVSGNLRSAVRVVVNLRPSTSNLMRGSKLWVVETFLCFPKDNLVLHIWHFEFSLLYDIFVRSLCSFKYSFPLMYDRFILRFSIS